MGTGGVVGDGVGEPVVLIAEARRNPGDITQRGAAGRTGHDRDTGSRRQERCPRSRRRPIHRHAVDINGRRSVAPRHTSATVSTPAAKARPGSTHNALGGADRASRSRTERASTAPSTDAG